MRACLGSDCVPASLSDVSIMSGKYESWAPLQLAQEWVAEQVDELPGGMRSSAGLDTLVLVVHVSSISVNQLR